MGLSITVGIRASALEDGAVPKDYFAGVNAHLAAAGLPAHVEPVCEAWGAEMYGYSGLHYLRRVAASLALRGVVPPPGDEHAPDDPLLHQYYERATGTARGLRRLLGRPRPRRLGFDHLMLHSDAEGYYVPIDFEQVIIVGDGAEMIGSSQRLQAECTRLRDALGIPADLDPEGDEVWAAADAQGAGEGWRRYGIESFTCVRLLRAAELSVARGAAIEFG